LGGLHFSNGEKMKQYNYKNNQLEGSSTWWGKSGKIWEEKTFKNNKEIN
jgi:antitoxin component YwqK of YwqJK toxin-antitoxin module